MLTGSAQVRQKRSSPKQTICIFENLCKKTIYIFYPKALPITTATLSINIAQKYTNTFLPTSPFLRKKKNPLCNLLIFKCEYLNVSAFRGLIIPIWNWKLSNVIKAMKSVNRNKLYKHLFALLSAQTFPYCL